MTRRALNYLAVLIDLGMGHLPRLIRWSFQTWPSKTQLRSGGRMLQNAAETFTIRKESAPMNSCYFQNQLPWMSSKVAWLVLNTAFWQMACHAGTASKVLLLILYLYHSGKQWLGRTLLRKFHEKPFIQPWYFLVLWPSENRKMLVNLDLKLELKTPESRCQVFF